MTNGAVFQLISNDGKQDKILMATAFLNKRLAMIYSARAADGQSDTTPTLLDIEKTHVLFMNAHFKPFAAIGYEYMKTSPQSTQAALGTGGGQIVYSIPQYGDFFGDMAVHFVLNAPSIVRTDDAVATDTSNGGGASSAPGFRYCAYPGERLFSNVAISVNGNDLDSYTPNSTSMYRNFFVTPSRTLAWNRCMGQESPIDGWVRQPGTDSTGATDAATGIFGASTQSSYRMRSQLLNGNQTPQLAPFSLDMWVPLLFWFNLDPRLAIPSVSIPSGQRYITLTLNAASLIYGLVPRGIGTWTAPRATLTAAANEVGAADLYINNIFVNPEVHDIFIQRVGFNLIRVHREHTASLQNASDNILLSSMKWPLETLYVGVRVTAYATTTTARHFDNWSSFRTRTVTAFAWNGVPVPYGAVPLGNTGTAALTPSVSTNGVSNLASAAGTPFSATTVGQVISVGGTLQVVVGKTDSTHITVAPGFATTTAFDAATGMQSLTQIGQLTSEYPIESNNVDTLTLTAHSINLYNTTNTAFYTDYLPFTYGGPFMSAPQDRGCIMINFCLYPGSYQPSGYMNVSRAREFYLQYTSSVVSSGNPCTLVVIGSALNFLLVTDGSAIIRYST